MDEKQAFHKLAKPVGQGTDGHGDYQLIPLSMVRGGKLVPRKVHTNPLRHLILDQDVKPRGWYKPKHSGKRVRPRPCYTEASLTSPYGGFCPVNCAHCYVNNGTRGYRATGLPTVDPTYPEKMAKSISQMNISGAFYISSFTEPFHHLEGKYGVTHRLTNVLEREGLPFFYLSRRIPPDWAVDALLQNPYSYMQWSINTPNPDHWHKLSPGAPDLQDIFDRMAELSKAGIYISVQCNPIIAGVTTLNDLKSLVYLVKEYGGHHIIFKFVEQVANNRKVIVERMMQSKLPHVDEFDNLFSQVIGGVYTIQEDVRIQWLDELLECTRAVGLTMGLCYEYFEDGNAGSSLGPFYTTSRGGCHGQSVPLYFRPEKGAPFEPLPGCFESGCLYCEENGTRICANTRLLEAGMLSMKDYKSILLKGKAINWDMKHSCPSKRDVDDYNHWYPSKDTFAGYYGWYLD
jgi:DNA repair photolyase